MKEKTKVYIWIIGILLVVYVSFIIRQYSFSTAPTQKLLTNSNAGISNENISSSSSDMIPSSNQSFHDFVASVLPTVIKSNSITITDCRASPLVAGVNFSSPIYFNNQSQSKVVLDLTKNEQYTLSPNSTSTIIFTDNRSQNATSNPNIILPYRCSSEPTVAGFLLLYSN
jgi:hypothetical protein